MVNAGVERHREAHRIKWGGTVWRTIDRLWRMSAVSSSVVFRHRSEFAHSSQTEPEREGQQTGIYHAFAEPSRSARFLRSAPVPRFFRNEALAALAGRQESTYCGPSRSRPWTPQMGEAADLQGSIGKAQSPHRADIDWETGEHPEGHIGLYKADNRRANRGQISPWPCERGRMSRLASRSP